MDTKSPLSLKTLNSPLWALRLSALSFMLASMAAAKNLFEEPRLGTNGSVIYTGVWMSFPVLLLLVQYSLYRAGKPIHRGGNALILHVLILAWYIEYAFNGDSYQHELEHGGAQRVHIVLVPFITWLIGTPCMLVWLVAMLRADKPKP